MNYAPAHGDIALRLQDGSELHFRRVFKTWNCLERPAMTPSSTLAMLLGAIQGVLRDGERVVWAARYVIPDGKRSGTWVVRCDLVEESA